MLNNSNNQTLNITIGIVGLGYVGLPLACEFSKFFNVIGFDISQFRIDNLKKGMDSTNETNAEALKSENLQFTTNPELLKEASVLIVTVPTPIDSHNKPDLSPLVGACTTVGKYLKKGTTVVFESTVYPGITEDICLPILEKESGLKINQDFYIGYSPERINPGDKVHSLAKVIKIVSGSTAETLDFLALLYGKIITAGIHKAPSIKVAEAAKIIENTQRDLNVALMNELSLIFNRLNINTYDVIEAASTKWNFIKMTPGLVGGHCIGVDPYYLTFKAEEVGYYPELILAGRKINDCMGKYIAENAVKLLIKDKKQVRDAKILIYGITFKENVPDIRNSKVVDIVKELQEYGVEVLVTDVYANSQETLHEYGITLIKESDIDQVDGVIMAVPHHQYLSMNLNELSKKILGNDGAKLLMDIKGIYRNQGEQLNQFQYWSL